MGHTDRERLLGGVHAEPAARVQQGEVDRHGAGRQGDPLGSADQGQAPASGDVDEVRAAAERIQANIAKVIEGKPEIARSALVVLLAGGTC